MIIESTLAFLLGALVGAEICKQYMIKYHRRLYNLNTNFNLLYAEYTEKDKIFDEIKKEPSRKISGL